MLRNAGYVLEKLDWMYAERIWPNGLRYLWTDAFGVVLYSRSPWNSSKNGGWTKWSIW